MAITKEKLRENTISIINDLEPTLIEKLDTLLDSGAINQKINICIIFAITKRYSDEYLTQKYY